MTEEKSHRHYFRDVSGLNEIDVYRILELFEVTCPVAQHIVKKALAAGKRGAKDSARDMRDIQDSAGRWLEMRREDLSSAAKAPEKANSIDVFWGTTLHKSADEVVKNNIARSHLDNVVFGSPPKMVCD